MTKAEIVLASIGWALAVAAVVDRIRLARRHRRELAKRSVEALSGYVQVDGISLPHPDDSRWERTERTLSGDKKESSFLKLGVVFVKTDASFDVYIDHGQPCGPPYPPYAAYAKRVVTAYRQRLIEKSLK